MAELAVRPLATPLGAILARPPRPGTRLFWLGQAGFVIETAGRRLVIDPYLSDSLAGKYRTGRFPHERMMPPPADAGAFRHVAIVLATHHHTDHMDAATLEPLFAACPDAVFVAPAASGAEARERSGLGGDRLVLVDAGNRVDPFAGLCVTATPAAHEIRERDAQGRHRFLGYLFETSEGRIWHSGDCVPFDGLAEAVAPLRPDLALLPVNGRRPELSLNGVPGNFTLEEAIGVAEAVGARTLLVHHYGLFAFNTADPAAIDAAAGREGRVRLLRAATGVAYECA